MLKILNTAQIREADQYTILNEPITPLALMERAAGKCSEWLKHNLPGGNPAFPAVDKAIYIVCGQGNNGGDGLVIGRHLARNGFAVNILILASPAMKSSPEFEANLTRIKKQALATITQITGIESLPDIREGSTVIDAIFGSGLSKPAGGLIGEVISRLNHLPVQRIAIDLPSGLYSEKPNDDETAVIFRADTTLSFLPPKMNLLAAENEPFCGKVHLFDIGLHVDYLNSAPSHHWFLTLDDVRQMIKVRSRFGHKGTYGHALVVAGSHHKAGAALLTARACLQSGAGLVTAHIPASAVSAINSFCPEIMVSCTDNHKTELPPLDGFSAAGAGPGLGISAESAIMVKNLINSSISNLVLDADALNILSENPTWLAFLKPDTILTPHPKEFERLAGVCRNTLEAIEKQRNLSTKHGIIIIRKGAHSTITTPDGNTYWNDTGNPGMATAGSGDVLTGIITGLLSQHYSPVEAALAGTWLHGMAGDLAVKSSSEEWITASDIINHLGQAFLLSSI